MTGTAAMREKLQRIVDNMPDEKIPAMLKFMEFYHKFPMPDGSNESNIEELSEVVNQ